MRYTDTKFSELPVSRAQSLEQRILRLEALLFIVSISRHIQYIFKAYTSIRPYAAFGGRVH